MRALRIERRKRTALAGAVLIACGLGCVRPLPDGGRDGGVGGGAGDEGSAGRGGAGGSADTGGSGGTGGTGGSGGSAGTGGTCPTSCGPVACSVRAGQPRVLVT